MKKKQDRNGFSWMKAIGLGLILAFTVRSFFFSSYIVEGQSMSPTLQEGNLLVINKIGYQFGELKRFDVIVFHANEKEDYVKRIIGLPGDRISYENDILYINGKPFEEPFLQPYKSLFTENQLTFDFTLQEITGEETVPEGHLFVIGDNRIGSFDSRHFGFIQINQVVGKVNLRYFPLDQLDISF
ncbi:signal peptidase I [Bacillus salitolerans]|uniref:Signal peptidase I n=1 Tax=Bacillus salitolerans TaxID=1437434 RepID=A0ABW4LWF0_9BACI